MAGKTEFGGLVTFTVMVAGKTLKESYQVVSIEISKAVNKIPSAKIKLVDGGISQNNPWEASDSGDFSPGNAIEIKVGYHSSQTSVYKGIIIKHGIKINKSGGSYLTVECKGMAVKLTVGRKNAIFIDKKDSDIFSEIINTYGISKEIAATDFSHKELVQHYCTDWDFLLTRAEVNGLIVVEADEKLIIKKPDLDAEPTINIEYGVDMISFQAEMDARTQLSKVTAVSWDTSKQAIIKSISKKPAEVSQGSISSSQLSQVLGLEEYVMQTTAGIKDASVLEAWATAKHTRSYLSKITGTVTCMGNASVHPGGIISLAGLSKQFNGKGFVNAVRHLVQDGDWILEVDLGLPFDWFTEETPLIDSPSASGLVPPVKGLFIAKVLKIHEDESGEYRVKIKIPLMEKDNIGIWARLSNLYASNEFGAFFYPEVNDEVVVGFLNEDPQYPVILGMLYSKSMKPPIVPDAENKIKGIVTRSKLKITFDDDKKILAIETPAKNTMTFDDDQGSIVIEDKNKNKIEMTKDGISITSEKDIIMKAKGKIVIQAQGNIESKATGDVKTEGMNVELKGSMKFAAEGAMTEVKGSGQTTIKGGIVMIN